MTKVAMIGAGSMASCHIPAFNALDAVEVVGITSRTREKADLLAKEHDIAYVADSVAELYEKTKADLVIMTVPELAANKIAKECFTHPWAVLMEKPAGYCLEDAQDIFTAAKDTDNPVMVGFNRRFYDSTQQVKADLDSMPDEPRFIHVQDQQSYEEARYFNHPEEVVEKFMYANSIHNIDYIRHLGRGKITDVKPVTKWEGEKTRIMLAHVMFDSGDTALYEGIWQGPGPWACTVSTRKKRWEMRPLEGASFQPHDSRRMTAVEIDSVDTTYKAGFYRQAEAVIAVVNGEVSLADSPAVSLEDSLETMQLIHDMFGV